MPYEPTIWQSGDVITAEKLNKIEQALYELSGGGGDEPPAGYVVVAPKQSVTLTDSEETLVQLTARDGYAVTDPLPTDLLVKVNGTVLPYNSADYDYRYSGDSVTYMVTAFMPTRIANLEQFGFMAFDATTQPVAGTYEVVIYAPAQ
jgi:hypothetical protein